LSSPDLTTIESSGTTSLLTDGTDYYLQIGDGPAVELSYDGAPVTVGEFGAWTPIAAQQTATGFEVALKEVGADQYGVWDTDSSGNYVSSPISNVSGISAALESSEASFNDDLNGDGIVGVPVPSNATVIESSGTTRLLTDGTNYFLQPAGDGPVVDLSYNGAPVTVGEFGAWAPIAAQQTATGYEVALKEAGADLYGVWDTDNSGNYVSAPLSNVSGTSAALESVETSFNDDLNGDGIIGGTGGGTTGGTGGGTTGGSPTVIESSGTTTLLTDGTYYYLEPNGGTAVKFSYGGAPVTVGEFGAWAPIAAQQTATGYEVALEEVGTDLYGVWDTDASGNFVSGPISNVSGTSAALESIETSFNDDLNGDGTIGVPLPSNLTVIESSGTTTLLTDGTYYYLEPNGGTAVKFSYGGAPVTVGEFGVWAPIAAQQIATGYEVALEEVGADLYGVWDTDGSGNWASAPLSNVTGTSAALESIETSFNDDLNGDGIIGGTTGGTGGGTTGGTGGGSPTVIESSGTVSLLTDGTNYFLKLNGGTTVAFSYNGAPVTVGEFGAWTPIAAQQTATGYEVALANVGADLYGVWDTESTGNFVSGPISNVSGTSAAFESMELGFNDDLNGDGTIGIPVPSNATVIESSGTTNLLQVGNTYLIEPNGEGAVQLTYGAQPVMVGEFGGLTPIAAQQTASGFEVAWRTPGADVYQVWDTDASGNYVSAPLSNVSGTDPALVSLETSFNDDLNNDGVIGAPSSSDQPLFAYQGTDANGAQVYDVTWNDQGNHPFAVRVLVPTDPSANYAHSFLYALPVENGLTGQSLGDGLDELESLDVENQYNTTIIEPIFPMYSWYADNPNDATIDYETFVADILPQWVDSHFSTTGDEQNLLIGFSKSGYGAVDLLLKHPTVFSAAAAFDFPADNPTYDGLGSSTADDYGTQANFQNNYELDQSFIDTYKAPFTTQDRLWISGGPLYASQVADFNNLLTSQGVMDTHSTTETSDAHSWTGGWVPSAVTGLFGLEQNLHPRA
jgi:cytochrome c2